MKILYFLIPLIFLFILIGCASFNKKESPPGGKYDENTMKSLVKPPKKTSLFMKIMIKIADKKAKKKMMTGRVISWLPKMAFSSGLLELDVENSAASCLDSRLIKLLRMEVSYTVPSPFAIDINSQDYQKFHITQEELEGLQSKKSIESVSSFSKQEKVALRYGHQLSIDPIQLSQKNLDDLRALFTEKQIVAIASLTAKVNYWTRLIEGLRIKSAKFTDDPNLRIEEYNTLTK